MWVRSDEKQGNDKEKRAVVEAGQELNGKIGYSLTRFLKGILGK